MITSRQNQQMKRIMLLEKKAGARREQGLFVAEGKKMFSEAPRDWLRGVYVSEHFAADPGAGKLLSDVEYEVVADSVFEQISDTVTPQGIISLVKTPQYPFLSLFRGRRTHLLILEGIQDPGNLGTMLRTAEGAGVTGVVINRTTADLFAPKTVRSTMGSIYRMPYFIAENLAETIREIKAQGVRIFAAHLSGAGQYDAADYTGATAFLIGSEGSGLSEEISALSDERVRIPMEGAVESLNAAVSAALLMYEAKRQRGRGNGSGEII